jgi:DNA-directed RNA polymerase specialized sigma24 family protein
MMEAAIHGMGGRPEPEMPVNCSSPEEFEYWFSRCRGLLHFLACRMLGDPRKANLAVESCREKASQSSRTFDREGAFRSWLLRILIDEALLIRNRDRRRASGTGSLFLGLRSDPQV